MRLALVIGFLMVLFNALVGGFISWDISMGGAIAHGGEALYGSDAYAVIWGIWMPGFTIGTLLIGGLIWLSVALVGWAVER